jgi:hypothetical protein
MEALAGQQSEVVTRALVKLAPSGAQAESSVERLKTVLSRSSARIRITFGPASGAGVPDPGVVGPPVLTFDRSTLTVSPSPEQASGKARSSATATKTNGERPRILEKRYKTLLA